MLIGGIDKIAVNRVASDGRLRAEFKGEAYDQSGPERLCKAALDALERRCPDHIEHHRWREAIADGAHFLVHWGEQAAALGWTPRDLFGLAKVPDKPKPNYQQLSRYDQTGLIWLLQGRLVVALTKDTAAIETATGTVCYRRCSKPTSGPLGKNLDHMGSHP